MTTTLDSAQAAPAPEPSKGKLRGLLDAQRAAHRAEGIPSLEVRLDRVDRFALAILENADAIAAALAADFGSRGEFASLSSDVIVVISEVEQLRKNLKEWMQDREVPGSAEVGLPAFVQVRPKGVVGVVGPWNFPVGLVASPTLEALGAGNRVMIKMSEISARAADVVAEAIARRMTPEEVVVVRGGVGTATAFATLPFDHLIFTGSPQVGAHVAASAGANLVPVTLELGGKNPVVVARDADIATSAQRVAGTRMLNGGQVCLCPDYVFVPTAAKDDFVAAYERTVQQYFPTFADNPAVVSIINDPNFDRVVGLIADAEGKGATVTRVVPADEASRLPDARTRRIAPSILTDVTDDMLIETEEIFGPVIVVKTYDDVSEVIRYVIARPSPLAAYWFGEDSPEFRQFLTYTTSGGVSRNDCVVHWSVDGAPSGGVGRSGMGAYSGRIGFDTFSHLRTVATSERPGGVAERVLGAGEQATSGIKHAIAQARDAIEARLG